MVFRLSLLVSALFFPVLGIRYHKFLDPSSPSSLKCDNLGPIERKFALVGQESGENYCTALQALMDQIGKQSVSQLEERRTSLQQSLRSARGGKLNTPQLKRFNAVRVAISKGIEEAANEIDKASTYAGSDAGSSDSEEEDDSVWKVDLQCGLLQEPESVSIDISEKEPKNWCGIGQDIVNVATNQGKLSDAERKHFIDSANALKKALRTERNTSKFNSGQLRRFKQIASVLGFLSDKQMEDWIEERGVAADPVPDIVPGTATLDCSTLVADREETIDSEAGSGKWCSELATQVIDEINKGGGSVASVASKKKLVAKVNSIKKGLRDARPTHKLNSPQLRKLRTLAQALGFSELHKMNFWDAGN